MGKLLKWVVIVVIALIALVVAAALAVVAFVDPNDYREDIAAVVERNTGRSLAIDGDIELSFFPRLGLAVNDVALADAPGFGEEPFAEVGRVTLGVGLSSLISGEPRLDTITLEGLRLRLIRNADGEANWEQFTPPAQKAAAGQVVPVSLTPVQQDGAAPALPAMVRNARLDGVEVSDARISYRDEGAGTAFAVEPLNLSLEDVRFGAPVPLEADWQASLGEGVSLAGELAATLQVDDALREATVTGIALDLTASGDGVPAGEQTVTVSGEARADLAGGTYRIPELSVAGAGAELHGNAEVRTTDQGPVAAASLNVPAVSPREVMDALDMAVPETRDPDVLKRLEASTELRYSGGTLRADPLNLTLDDTTVKGTASVSDFADPAIAFDLSTESLNVDRYLPPASEGGQQAGTPGGAAAKGAGEIPVDTLRALNLDGRLAVGQLTVSGLKLSDVEVVVRAADGKLRVHPLNAALYGGNYQGDVRVDATGEEPRVQVDERLSGVSAGPLLTDMAGFERLLGTANLSLQASTAGRQTDALIKALQGQARFEFTDGAVKGINIAQMLREAVARFRGESVKEAAGERRTDFSSLTGTVQIDGGVLRNKDLQAKTPLLRLDGDGDVNLVSREMDYNLTVNVVGSLEGQGGEELAALKRVPVPLRFRGPLTGPSVELAVGEALQRAAQGRVKEKVDEKKAEVKAKAKEEIEKKVGDRLKGLFGD
ncbi:AsmA family protein [Arhodomonas aquaeolei]|uniref:AsmA family protein n=1 Tax=Arhodomonas TaxID=2368 RepID=UPI0013D49C6E|nr:MULTISPECIES: AsmA family protein [Arhodomonas]MCS4503071.1 AsmA family protein [Arhodomonas aquaeolei]